MIAEWLIIVLVGLLLIAVPLTVSVMAIVAFNRSRRIIELTRRLEQLERLETQRRPAVETAPAPPRAAMVTPAASTLPPTATASNLSPTSAETTSVAEPGEPIQWELLIGKRALGWVAVVLVIFGAAFFLRYAVDNDWLGPIGQVALAEFAGLALVIAGSRFAGRGWRVFSQMLSAAGIVVLYLATFAAFGFYQLLSREVASAFLLAIILESALLALGYNSLAIAMTAVLGGLLTPVLMHSSHDDYVAFFAYLTSLNLGVVTLLLARRWVAIGTVAILGTQGLFWSWYVGNYHPEKFGGALGFQFVLLLIYLGHNLAIHHLARRRAGSEDLVRMVLAAIAWFAALYTMLRDDPELWFQVEPWMGVVAIAMAVIYALIAWWMARSPRPDPPHVAAALAVSVGFIALAFPLQADTAWVALGWAVEGAALWWWGQRIAARPLRLIAVGLFVAAVVRLLAFDLPPQVREPFTPIFNSFALPAIGVAVAMLTSVSMTRPFLRQRGFYERLVAGAIGASSVLLLWLVLSLDCYDYFESLAHEPDAPRTRLLWVGQMALSVLWAVFATTVLVVGFRTHRPWLRWMALALYGATVLKVFLVDIRELDEIYRIVAFLVLAVFLALAAWGYQRLAPVRREPTLNEETRENGS